VSTWDTRSTASAPSGSWRSTPICMSYTMTAIVAGSQTSSTVFGMSGPYRRRISHLLGRLIKHLLPV